jgi:transposase
LLATVGIAEVKLDRHFLCALESLRGADGQPVPRHLRRELEREFERWSLLQQQIKAVEQEQAQQLLEENNPAVTQVKLLQTLRGVGPVAAHTLVFELFAWRDFKNRRELGGYLGLTPTPYNSGDSEREQGISKAGPRRLRALLVELAWFWLRYQPGSALSLWYQARCEGASSRVRRTTIVALARKLAIDLWKYVARGVVPEGAVFKEEFKGALPKAA